jgi:uncharacterized membrane protein YgaE (UPF0421/DUF939 family)
MADTIPARAAHPDVLSFHQGLRTAIAAGLAYGLGKLLHLEEAYWAAMSAILVMQSDVGATISATRDRLAGNAIGAVVGGVVAYCWHDSIAIFALGVLAVMMICTALRFERAGRLGGAAVAIIVLFPRPEPVWQIALGRFLEISFGVIVSFLVTMAWIESARWIGQVRAKMTQTN